MKKTPRCCICGAGVGSETPHLNTETDEFFIHGPGLAFCAKCAEDYRELKRLAKMVKRIQEDEHLKPLRDFLFPQVNQKFDH